MDIENKGVLHRHVMETLVLTAILIACLAVVWYVDQEKQIVSKPIIDLYRWLL